MLIHSDDNVVGNGELLAIGDEHIRPQRAEALGWPSAQHC